jgi:hypothetical protein
MVVVARRIAVPFGFLIDYGHAEPMLVVAAEFG